MLEKPQIRIMCLKIRDGILKLDGWIKYESDEDLSSAGNESVINNGNNKDCLTGAVPGKGTDDSNSEMTLQQAQIGGEAFPDISLGITGGSKDYEAEIYKQGDKAAFRLRIPAEFSTKLSFNLTINGEKIERYKIRFGKNGKLEEKKRYSYYCHDEYLVRHAAGKILIARATPIEKLKLELRYSLATALKHKEFRIAAYRLLTFFTKSKNSKPVWILSDRDNAAGDNGEAMFRYLADNKPDAKVYFTIDKKCSDYSRVRQYGKVLKLNSFSYKLNFLRADKIISAHGDDWVTNAFFKKRKYVKSLYDFDYVFLQHGITHNDLSSWLNILNKDISIFVTSAKGEYDSILKYEYGYKDDVVKLTGLPRYDRLVSRPEKKIIILPTWRKSLGGEQISGTSRREYSTDFKNSDYCKFYNSLINDQKLISFMKEHGYTGEMYVHPAFSVQARDFRSDNDVITVHEGVADYNRLFKIGSLLITDFSSVAFDFAYMKKPIIYTQFDRDIFYDRQFYTKGYFDYERDGFGPVCYNYRDSVEAIRNIIKSDCIMDSLYAGRVDNFFCWNDRNNCSRVYDEILKLKR